MPGATVEIYKTVGDVELKAWIYAGKSPGEGELKPAIVFFFGGGWRGGTPAQFQKHAEYLKSRGMVAIVADYRVSSRHGVKAKACVSDAKSAIRWIREESPRLGIDPDRIAAGGGSAGGHLAAAAATLPGFDEPTENTSVSSQPNALVLFNPGVVLAPIPVHWEPEQEFVDKFRERLGTELESMSPYHHVRAGIGPTIIFHGTADKTVPYFSVELFREAMLAKGNRCELVGYKGAGHGFFNAGRRSNAPYYDTVHRMDAFLVSIGYLNGPPEVEHLR